MNLGFVIDQRRCIGCHACTVACKAENGVPVGDFRTWVKYVEKGRFPEVRRHFTVLRCNHCDAAPCVEICPTHALHKRPDRIVDLDRDRCIGCRACMQACPYDALYLNTDRGVAEKCHFCAHRIESGLEPACVVVCPEQAIVAGDTADGSSRISRLIEEQPTTRRKETKGTEPRVWYIDGAPEGLEAGRSSEPVMWLFSDRKGPPPPDGGGNGTMDAVTTLNAEHGPVWGAHIWQYVLTKNAAAGVMLIAPFLGLLGVVPEAARGVLPEVVALAFTALTCLLLVDDLPRRWKFVRLLTMPNTRSWLVRGAWIIGAFGAVTTLSLLARWLDWPALATALRWICLPLAALMTGYSAWLFGQCAGRDLWLESGLFTHLVLRSAGIGAGLAVILPSAPDSIAAPVAFGGMALANAVWIRVRLIHPPLSEAGRRAHAILSRDPQSRRAVLLLAVAAAAMVPLVAFDTSRAVLGGLALAVAGVGDLIYERAWIKAGQAVPLS